MRKVFVLALLLCAALPLQAQNTKVYFTDQGDKLVVASGGTLEVADGATFTMAESISSTLGADEKFLVDGATTAQTQTDGSFDLNVASITTGVSAFNLALTANNGAATGADITGAIITLTANDADADVRGITMSAAATTNAAANSYEYGLSYDCAENSAGACIDGIILLSSGISGGLVDAVDASASNITNAINIGANLILGGDDSVSIGATDDTLILTSNDSTPTFMGADAASPSDTIYDTTGAGAITVGSADVTSVTLSTDGTGDAEVALPENSIGPDEVAAVSEQVILCGDIDAGATTFWGPNTTLLGGDYSASSAISSAACQGLDSTTEATADAPLFANTAFKVQGMFCKVTSSGSNGVTMTLRSAEADLTPSVTCTIATGETTCSSVTASTTDVAAGATLAVEYEDTEDLSAQDGWCKVFLALK